MCYGEMSGRQVHVVVSEDMSTDNKELIQVFVDPKKADNLAAKLNEVNPSVRYAVTMMDVTY